MILFNNKKRNKYIDISDSEIVDIIKYGNYSTFLYDKLYFKNSGKYFKIYKKGLLLKDVINNIRILKSENSYDNYNLFYTCDWELLDLDYNVLKKSKFPDTKYIEYVKKNEESTEFGIKLKLNILPAFVSGVESYGNLPHPKYDYKPNCTIENIKKVSNNITIDIDHLPLDRIEEIKSTLFNNFDFIKWVFRSPSGDGLKITIEFDDLNGFLDDIEKLNYRTISKVWLNLNNQIVDYINDEIGLKIEPDTSADDINRLCYLSYDPNILYREVVNPFEFEYTEIEGNVLNDKEDLNTYVEVQKEKMVNRRSNYNTDLKGEIRRIERFISNLIKYKVEPYKADYTTYMMVGFAICDLFGHNEQYKEDAFDFYRRITMLDEYYGNYHGFGDKEVERQFELKWGNNREDGIRYGSMIKWMNDIEDYIIKNKM